MEESLDKALNHYFGYTSLRPGQKEIIGRVCSGTNTLAVLPTGGGKSLCYQLPALVMDGLSVVISPLIALMRDQVEALASKGISAARIDSTTKQEGDEAVKGMIEDGELRLLYVSPERVMEPSMFQLLCSQKIALVAVDEAHCISEWGHSFRPSYIRLPKVIRKLKPDVVMALTATASPETARGIRKAFGILKRDQVQASFYRENLSFRVHVVAEDRKDEQVLNRLRQAGASPAIVYATRRGDVERIAAFLTNNNIPARAYHAGMPAEARAEVQDGFLQHRFPVICATIAFGMGVDMPDVRRVIHYHAPKSPEGWIQESGRAGRDGKPSVCELLVNGDDRQAIESMVIARQPSGRAVHAVLQNLFSQGNRAVVSPYNLSTLNDMPRELLDILFARLETAGWVVADGGSWMWCHVVPLRWDALARDRILHGFAKKDQPTIAHLIDSRKRVSLFDLADGQVVKLNALVRLLRNLEAAGDVRLQLSHSLMHYRIKKMPESIRGLADEMLQVYRQHAEHDLNRIAEVFQIALTEKCLAGSLVGYFGETLPELCGKCSSCRGEKFVRKLPTSRVDSIDKEELELVQSLIRERHPALSSPDRLARFLCGIYSPAMMRYRLYRHDSWGMLDRMSFEQVLAVTQAQLI